jgi:uncharacterized membrane protein YphA (DoxX/SURF4 family)
MKTALVWLGRLLIAGVFIYAGVVKLGTSEQFAITIAQIYILPENLIKAVVKGLPWTELLVGVLILIPRTARVGAVAASVLMVVFIGALAWAWSQGFTMGCGCFGEDDTAAGSYIPLAIVRDVVLLAITLLLAARRSR